MAITTYDGLLNAFNSSQVLNGFDTGGNISSGYYASMWTLPGSPGGAAVPTSGSGQTCDNTIGPLQYTAPSSGHTMYLSRWGMYATSNSSTAPNCEFVLHDRLVATSGLVGNSTSLQTVNTVSLPRSTDGLGVEIWIEWYTATGSTASNLTINYTNSDGTSQSQIITVASASGSSNRAYHVPYLQNDKGVLSVQSVQFSASTGTAGNFGVTLIKRITSMLQPSGNVAAQYYDPVIGGLPPIPDGACLNLYSRMSTFGGYDYEIGLVEG